MHPHIYCACHISRSVTHVFSHIDIFLLEAHFMRGPCASSSSLTETVLWDWRKRSSWMHKHTWDTSHNVSVLKFPTRHIFIILPLLRVGASMSAYAPYVCVCTDGESKSRLLDGSEDALLIFWCAWGSQSFGLYTKPSQTQLEAVLQ